MQHSTFNRSLSILSIVVVGLSITFLNTGTVSAFGCTADSDWCCWPPYPATPLWGALAGYDEHTDCPGDTSRTCIANTPYAYFTDCR